MGNDLPQYHGRGAQTQTANRFERLKTFADLEHLDECEIATDGAEKIQTQYLPDNSKSIIAENDSPDIAFRYSLNPYRGCAHGWLYLHILPPCTWRLITLIYVSCYPSLVL
mgnify:CR=1 FL=1